MLGHDFLWLKPGRNASFKKVSDREARPEHNARSNFGSGLAWASNLLAQVTMLVTKLILLFPSQVSFFNKVISQGVFIEQIVLS